MDSQLITLCTVLNIHQDWVSILLSCSSSCSSSSSFSRRPFGVRLFFARFSLSTEIFCLNWNFQIIRARVYFEKCAVRKFVAEGPDMRAKEDGTLPFDWSCLTSTEVCAQRTELLPLFSPIAYKLRPQVYVCIDGKVRKRRNR